MVTVALIAVAGAFISRTVAEGQALAEARRLNGVVARTVVEPHLRDGLLTGDPAALAPMREAARLLTDGPVLRLKLWTPDGRVVYSDDERLIGRQYPLGPDEAEVLVTGDAAAEITDLSRAENDLEHDLGTLVEVYRPVRTPSGDVLLFETYMPLSSLADRTSAVWMQFLPITVGALVLLQLVQFPLAVRLARQTARARRDRELMLHRSLAASDAERRRIAADLHDGVVQDLAATSIALAGAAVEADRAGSRAESGRLHLAADAVRAGDPLPALARRRHPPAQSAADRPGRRARRPHRDHDRARGRGDAGGRRRSHAAARADRPSSSPSAWRKRRCATSSRTPTRRPSSCGWAGAQVPTATCSPSR